MFHSINKSDCQVGDHVYVWASLGVYAHHGIVVWVNECNGALCTHEDDCAAVVHFAPESSSGGKGDSSETLVRLTSLAQFSGGKQLKICKYGASDDDLSIKRSGTCVKHQSDPPHRVVFRALSLTGWGAGEYNLLVKNCELISQWCKLGDDKIADPRSSTGSLTGQTDPARVTWYANKLADMKIQPGVATAAAVTAGAFALAYIWASKSSIGGSKPAGGDDLTSYFPNIIRDLLKSIDAELPETLIEPMLSDKQSITKTLELINGTLKTATESKSTEDLHEGGVTEAEIVELDRMWLRRLFSKLVSRRAQCGSEYSLEEEVMFTADEGMI